DRRPLVIVCQVLPPSSVRKVPAEEMATKMRLGWLGSWMMVCRQSPPAPGAQDEPVPVRRLDNSSQVWPASVLLKSAASCAPAKTVSGSFRDGSKCQIRVNSKGRGVPSYQG